MLISKTRGIRCISQPGLHPLSVSDPSGDVCLIGPKLVVRHPSCTLGPLTPYSLSAAEAGDAPVTTAALASHEPGFWLSGTPPWECTDHQGAVPALSVGQCAS
ncbi:unnamed protein product [Pipistrellus nathusii]|uniref:Uncharacterized protein n=1 Tax=Pipistrellus nathusii TaxID=59473 RepID=A0ABN9ZEK4_PIPNA